MKPWIARCAGVLLDLRALPSGKLDADAWRFTELALEAGLRVWQLLPVGTRDAHNNPFQPASAFAGDTTLLPADRPTFDEGGYREFLARNSDWLEDWALFVALKCEMPGLPWWQWPAALRHRDADALAAARLRLRLPLEQERREQYCFAQVWQSFKRQANQRGVQLFGDVPLFVAHDSADVWSQPQLFELLADGRCAASVGVPPDAFSAEGQWWGYPPYRWERMAAEEYRWWKRRFEVQASRFDLLRIDHFRGLCAFWRVPGNAASAAEGAWTPAPGAAAIEAIRPVLGGAQLVAEDLGVITADVLALRKALGLPGMCVLQFAFDGDPANVHLPAHHANDSLCYTGTHDNDTTLGWWQSLEPWQQELVRKEVQQAEPAMPAALVNLAWASPAPLAVVPMQDLLGLGTAARTNRPGIAEGNWCWRFAWLDLPLNFAALLRESLQAADRIRQ